MGTDRFADGGGGTCTMCVTPSILIPPSSSITQSLLVLTLSYVAVYGVSFSCKFWVKRF